jgi:hypothetical protein
MDADLKAALQDRGWDLVDGSNDASEMPDPNDFSAARWLERDLPSLDYLLGDCFTTTTRAELIGPTGIGKSNFALAIAWSIATGSPFLHWRARRAAKRVLYLDGEMSARVARDRMREASKRHGSVPDNLFFINRDDYPGMPPLNTEAGQRFMDALIAQAGGIEFIVLDNIQSLLVGDMKEEDGWAATLPWVRSLTRRAIGQLWAHHTGHDTTRGYGSKTREWQLDLVMLMTDRADKGELLVDFDLSFTKARERNRENRGDFADARIWINADDQWESSTVPAEMKPRKSRSLPLETMKALDYLGDVLVEHGETPGRPGMPRGIKAVKLDRWRDYLRKRGLCEADASGRQTFKRHKDRLIAASLIAIDDEFVWKVAR